MNVSLLDKQPKPPLAEKLVTLHDLDKGLLLRYIAYPEQYDAVNEFIQAIRTR